MNEVFQTIKLLEPTSITKNKTTKQKQNTAVPFQMSYVEYSWTNFFMNHLSV